MMMTMMTMKYNYAWTWRCCRCSCRVPGLEHRWSSSFLSKLLGFPGSWAQRPVVVRTTGRMFVGPFMVIIWFITYRTLVSKMPGLVHWKCSGTTGLCVLHWGVLNDSTTHHVAGTRWNSWVAHAQVHWRPLREIVLWSTVKVVLKVERWWYPSRRKKRSLPGHGISWASGNYASNSECGRIRLLLAARNLWSFMETLTKVVGGLIPLWTIFVSSSIKQPSHFLGKNVLKPQTTNNHPILGGKMFKNQLVPCCKETIKTCH